MLRLYLICSTWTHSGSQLPVLDSLKSTQATRFQGAAERGQLGCREGYPDVDRAVRGCSRGFEHCLAREKNAPQKRRAKPP